MNKLSNAELYERGWDHGNYAQSYETSLGLEYCSRAALFCEAMDTTNLDTAQKLYVMAGMVLGYYSSCEYHEIADETGETAYFEAALRFARAKGLDSHRDREDGVDAEELAAEAAAYSKNDARLLEELLSNEEAEEEEEEE